MKEKASRDTRVEWADFFFLFEKNNFSYMIKIVYQNCVYYFIFYDNCLRLKPVCYLKIRTVYLLIKDVLFYENKITKL